MPTEMVSTLEASVGCCLKGPWVWVFEAMLPHVEAQKTPVILY